MSRLTNPFRCDGCGKLRETDANRWWLLREMNVPDSGAKSILIFEWTNEEAERDGTQHSCGEDCAQKLFSRWLQSGTFEPASARPIAKTLEEEGDAQR